MRISLAAMFLGLSAILAVAHSRPVLTQPADGAVLSEAPAQIVLRFDDGIRLTLVRAVSNGGTNVEFDLSPFDDFMTEYTFPAPQFDKGSYQIDWRGLGVDGHAMTGKFGFVIQ